MSIIFKQIMIAMLLTIGVFTITGCNGGEADYTLGEVQGNQFLFLSSAYVYVEDNATEIIELQVRSQSSVEFEIIGGDDSAMFDINTTTGVITYATGVEGVVLYALDPDKVYLVVVQAVNLDGEDESMVLRVQIVKDLTLVKPFIDSAVNTDPNTLPTLDQTITTVTAQSATGTEITYVLSGPDSVFFDIDENGNLHFKTIPTFEPKQDANQDNIFEVTVEVSDDYQTSTVDLRVTIAQDSDLVKPTIVTASVQDYVENDDKVIYIEAVSGTEHEIRYSLVPGYDETDFTIDSVTGALIFVQVPDYEAPHDGNRDNIYEVEVRITDQGAYANEITRLFTISVSGVNEGVPNFSGPYISLKDDAGNEVETDELLEQTHYTMLFQMDPLNPDDTVTLTLAPYDESDWSSDKKQYDPEIFSVLDGALYVQVPSISSGIFGSTSYKDYYVRVIATDEHGNSSYRLLSITGRST